MAKIASWITAIICVACITAIVRADPPPIGQGKIIGLDYFFNHQEKNGKQFHYIWDDTANSGYSKFAAIWQQYGTTTTSIKTQPTRADLDKLSIYMICNPSTVKNAADGKPNYMNDDAATTIAAWVNDGGVLLLFANDKNNCEIEHFNILTQKFGITLNDDLRNAEPTKADAIHCTFNASQFPDSPLFKGVGMIWIKEICTLQVKDPATALMTVDNEQGTGKDIVMATAQFGKGFVFAVGDPWFYNEYIDAKPNNLPVENHKAADNFVQWILPMAAVPKSN